MLCELGRGWQPSFYRSSYLVFHGVNHVARRAGRWFGRARTRVTGRDGERWADPSKQGVLRLRSSDLHLNRFFKTRELSALMRQT